MPFLPPNQQRQSTEGGKSFSSIFTNGNIIAAAGGGGEEPADLGSNGNGRLLEAVTVKKGKSRVCYYTQLPNVGFRS